MKLYIVIFQKPKYIGPSTRPQSQCFLGLAQDDNQLVVNSGIRQSATVIRNSARRRFFFSLGNGLRSRWQSRQSDRAKAEADRRSSELRGALHSSQRGGPTRPL